MERIIPFTSNDLAKITNHRSGEIKFGEKIITVPKDTDIVEFITNNEAKFVLFGIPEDIGVKANLGRIGAASAYDSALQSLANIQHNKFCKGSNLLVLGKLNVDELLEKAQNLDANNKEHRKEAKIETDAIANSKHKSDVLLLHNSSISSFVTS